MKNYLFLCIYILSNLLCVSCVNRKHTLTPPVNTELLKIQELSTQFKQQLNEPYRFKMTQTYLKKYIPENIRYENFGYANMYIVDTIKIENPIWLWTNNYRFVMPERVYELYDGNEMFFFIHPEVFLYQDLFPFPGPTTIWNKYVSSMCDFHKSPEYSTLREKKGIDIIYKFAPEPKFFLFVLINGYYYNDSYCGFDDTPPLKLNNIITYYRMAIPLCK